LSARSSCRELSTSVAKSDRKVYRLRKLSTAEVFMIGVRHILLGSLFVCLLSACAPDLGVRLSVPSVPDPEHVAAQEGREGPLKVKVGTFLDKRPSDTIAIIDGRQVPSEGSLGGVVQEGLANYLRKAGARIAVLQAPQIEGEIVEWKTKVSPDFPTSSASATARIKVVVRGIDSSIKYRASFAGEASMSHPALRASHVKELLAQAMGSALEEVVTDASVVEQLSAAQAR
jgi:hypothetical protein